MQEPQFAKDPDRYFIRELALLDALTSRLPVDIPRLEWTGRHTRFAAYRAVDGHHLDVDEYERAAVGDKATIAESFAATLAAIHASLSAEEIVALGVPALDYSNAVVNVSGALSALPIDTARNAETVLRPAWVAIRLEDLSDAIEEGRPVDPILDRAGR